MLKSGILEIEIYSRQGYDSVTSLGLSKLELHWLWNEGYRKATYWVGNSGKENLKHSIKYKIVPKYINGVWPLILYGGHEWIMNKKKLREIT
jgi:hypothetical protein